MLAQTQGVAPFVRGVDGDPARAKEVPAQCRVVCRLTGLFSMGRHWTREACDRFQLFAASRRIEFPAAILAIDAFEADIGGAA